MSASRIVKHAADRVLAALLLVLLLPVLVAIALWILLDDGRPVLFVYPRAGRHGVPFRMLKFRTLVRDAIQIGRKQRLSSDPFGIIPNDPRVTRSGRFLRRTGLDELPQLVNILRGEMSLVGPRPDLVEQAANYTEHDRRRLEVLPGLTGWSQVNGREEIGWPERIEQDIWYIDHWSLWLDVRILLATAGQLFRPEPRPVEDTMNIERHRAARSSRRRTGGT
jgi:sugar transferase EpsL